MMKLMHTASATGAVHLIREGTVHTLCGRKARFTPTTQWPRWDTADASLDVRQRKTCPKCAAAAARLKAN